jgi:hypothetical protein
VQEIPNTRNTRYFTEQMQDGLENLVKMFYAMKGILNKIKDPAGNKLFVMFTGWVLNSLVAERLHSSCRVLYCIYIGEGKEMVIEVTRARARP